METQIMTFNECVKVAGVNRRTLDAEIKAGRLKTVDAGLTLMILAESFDEWRREHLPRIENTKRLGIGKLMRQRAAERKAAAAVGDEKK